MFGMDAYRHDHLPPLELAGAPPFTVGTVIGRSFSIWWKHLPALALISLVLDLPLLVVEGLAGPIEIAHPGYRLYSFVSVLLWWAVSAALTHATLRSLAGGHLSVGESLRAGLAKMWPVARVSFGTGLIVLLGAVLLVVPGIVAACALWLAVPAIVAEPGLSFSAALKRSRTLTQGSRTKIFVVALVSWLTVGVGLLALVLVISATELFVPPAVGAVLMEACATILFGIVAIAPAVAYHDLRASNEGIASGHLASVFD
jgi:hypothetical protein